MGEGYGTMLYRFFRVPHCDQPPPDRRHPGLHEIIMHAVSVCTAGAKEEPAGGKKPIKYHHVTYMHFTGDAHVMNG